MRIAGLVCLSILVAACGKVEPPKYTVTMPERQTRLPNGMRVFLLPDPTTDLVEVDVRYQVGSKEDPPGRAGLAHLVEHLMFQQRPAGPGQPSLGAVLRQATVYHNAFTNWDSTHYQAVGRHDALETLIGLEAARLATGCETITEETFAREREVVRNEVRQRLGTAEDQVLVRILEDVYPDGHPYRRMIGGDDAQLAAITLADACAFVRDYYVPERATLIVAGRVDERAVAAAIDRSLARVPLRAGKALVDVPAISGAKKPAVIHEMDVDEDSVIVAWPAPPAFGEDAEALLFLADMVTGRTASFGATYEFASDVEGIVLGGARAPIFAVRVGLRRRGDADEALAAIFRSASGSTFRLGQDDDWWKATRAGLLSNLTMMVEPLTTRARLYGDYAQFDEENKNFGGQLYRLGTLDPARLKAKVDRALERRNATVIQIRAKKGAGGSYARAGGGGLAAAASVTRDDDLPVERGEAALRVAVPERSTVLAGARRFTLDNGLRVVLLPTESPLPVVTAKLIFGVGEAHDPPAILGLARLAVDELSAPVASKAEGAWIYSFSGFALVGIQLDREVGPDTTVFTARGLAIHQDFLVKGLERMIKENRYSQESVEREQQVFELQQRRRAVQSERAVTRALAEGVYGAAHPYAATSVATPATRKKIGVDELHGHARSHFSAANGTLILAGAFDAARAERAIRDNFGGWSEGRVDTRVGAPAKPQKKGQVIGVVGAPSPVLRVHVAYPAPMGIDSSYAARRVLVEMLGRRLASVRERLGASYGVKARYEPRFGPSMIEIGGAVDADRGGEALADIRLAIDALRRGDGFLEDFVRARRAVLEESVINANDSLSLATRLELIARFDLPPTFFDDHVATLAGLTPQHVLALARRELDPALQVLVVEGERAPLEAAFAGAKITSDRIVEAVK